MLVTNIQGLHEYDKVVEQSICCLQGEVPKFSKKEWHSNTFCSLDILLRHTKDTEQKELYIQYRYYFKFRPFFANNYSSIQPNFYSWHDINPRHTK